MVKSINENKESKQEKKHPCTGRCTCGKCHKEEYGKKYEKEHFPRKVWPTDSEVHKKKGPKI